VKIVTLSWDDGFADSFPRVAEIYGRLGLSASLNVIARGHEKGFKAPDAWHEGFPKAGFDVWNRLQAQGHEVMPHGLLHSNKAAMPLSRAKSQILQCLGIFERKLKGFKRSRAIFNFPYNASTPEIEGWLAPQVRAFRTGGPSHNPLPHARTFRITCSADGGGNCEARLDKRLKEFLRHREGWFNYNTHGLDKEGWGPVRASYLEKLLRRLKKTPGVKIWSTTQALDWGKR
jgi:peptidoglycan/xylan/chitin deacetylase (PgdA/CDA1 family)